MAAPANPRDDWGRPLPGERAPRDWGTALQAIGMVIIPLVLALAGYAWHVESQLNDLAIRAAQTTAQIQGMQRQIDDEARREEAHNSGIDRKLDTMTELVGRTVTNLEDLRHELKR